MVSFHLSSRHPEFSSLIKFQLQDGICGSTCSIFAEMMTTLGKVRSVAVGGRPNNYPMAGVAGTKGSVELGWTVIHDYANLVFNLVPESDRAYLNSTDVGKIISATHSLKRAAGGGADAHINGANNIRKGDKSLTPLQFIWEAAHEKIFNTAEMILDPTAVWRAASDCGFHKLGCVKTVAPKLWNEITQTH